jgi:hypothetical protein
MDSPLYAVFSNILLDLPAHLVKLVGIVLCFVYWGRYPRACLLALIAILFFYLQSAIAVAVSLWVQTAVRRSMTATDIGTYFQISGFAQSVVKAIGFGLLFAAIFWRDERPKIS